MFKIGDRVEIVGGEQKDFKGEITHLYPDTNRVMVWLDTDKRGRSMGTAMIFNEIQIIKVN